MTITLFAVFATEEVTAFVFLMVKVANLGFELAFNYSF